MQQKHIFCKYLELVEHPKAKTMEMARLVRKEVPWATRDNYTDCGVFIMRHMEMFKGVKSDFDCGFSVEEDVNKIQARNLRFKYAARIMMAENNMLRDNMINEAIRKNGDMDVDVLASLMKSLEKHAEDMRMVAEIKAVNDAEALKDS
jgi:hypothetical protein